jgi:hypothetical protein
LEERMAVTVDRREGGVCVSLSGSVGCGDLDLAARLLERADRETPGLHRFVDTTHVTHVDLDFTTMLRFTNRCSRWIHARDVRIAILVRTDETYGFARMFQNLRDHPGVSVEVFRDQAEALAWLDDEEPAAASLARDRATLQPPGV